MAEQALEAIRRLVAENFGEKDDEFESEPLPRNFSENRQKQMLSLPESHSAAIPVSKGLLSARHSIIIKRV